MDVSRVGLRDGVSTLRGASWRRLVVQLGAMCCAGLRICVVGGALHSGFAFTNILPQVLNTPQLLEATKWKPMAGSSTCAGYMQVAQEKVMETYIFGYTPGPQAIMVASFWIAYVVATRETKFPRWFILFTPLVTVAWVAVVGFLVIPDPWGKYFVGAFGTWIILVMNVATSCILWNVNDQDVSFCRLQ